MIAKLVQISPILLWFMGEIPIKMDDLGIALGYSRYGYG